MKDNQALTTAYETGKHDERRRIIKLLKDFIEATEDFDGMAFYRLGVLDAIASIEVSNE